MASAATPEERLALRLEVQMAALEKGMRQVKGIVADGLKTTERRADDFAARMRESGERASSGFVSSLGAMRGALASVAVFLSAERIVAYADAWQNVTNRLAAAGVQGSAQADVLEKIFNIAQKNGLALDDLATLYSRTAQAATELGASQEQLETMTSAVAAAVRINGGSVESSRGALIQFAQALGSGTVRAEEFNSIQEGARPILVAVARNLDAAGGSVNKLKLLINEGKVTSEEFFAAFIKGAPSLEARANDIELTIAQTFQKVENEFTKFLGALNAAPALTVPLNVLADNIGNLARLAAVAAAAFVVWRAGLLATSVATQTAIANLILFNSTIYGTAAATTGAAVATNTLTGALITNPFVAVATVVAAATTAYLLFRDTTESVSEANARLFDELDNLAPVKTTDAEKTDEQTKAHKELNDALQTSKNLTRDYENAVADLSVQKAADIAATYRQAAAERQLALVRAQAAALKARETLAAGGGLEGSGLGAIASGAAAEKDAANLKAEIARAEKEAARFEALAEKLSAESRDSLIGEQDEPPAFLPPRPSRGRASGATSPQRNPVADIISAARARIQAIETETKALGMSKDAAEKYRFEQDLVARAAQQNVPLTAALAKEFNILASAYAAATAEQESAKKIQEGDDFIASANARVSALGVELAAMKMHGAEREKFLIDQELMALAREKEVDQLPDVAARIREIAASYAETKTAIADTKAAQEGFQDLKNVAADALEDILLNAKNAEDVLKDVFKLLASSALRNAFTGTTGGLSGGLSDFLSKLFGRSSGGAVNAGQMYRVNEGGMKKEYFQPAVPGVITTAPGNSGGATSITIDVRGANGDAQIQRIVQQGVMAGLAVSEQRRKAATASELSSQRKRYG